MKRQWERRVLAGILLLYLVVGAAYSVSIPVFESPDESYHFFVVKHIVDHSALPVQRAETRGLWEQEGSQPPLYYLAGALLVSWIDLSGAEELLWRNPQANIGDPLNPGNKNVYVHPPEQDWPWRGAVLAVHALRLFSLALGAATVLLVWLLVRLPFPRTGILAPVIAGMVAFIPQYLFITSAVNNDNLMTCLGTLSLFFLVQGLRCGTQEGGGAWGLWGGAGVVLGLALLSKLSALVLLGLAGLVIVLVGWYHRSWRLAWRLAGLVYLPALIISGWWYVRNVVLYGDPTGLTAMWEVVGRRKDFGAGLWGEFRGLRYSFWGLFGWFSIAMPVWVYRLLDVLSLLSLAGLVLGVGRWLQWGLWRGARSAFQYREPEWGAAYRPLALSLMGLWMGAILISLARWTSLTSGSQGRLLYPAIASIAAFFVLGLRAWFTPRARDAASAVLMLGMLALAVLTPWRWVVPHYARMTPVARLPEGAVPVDLSFGDAILMRGVRFPQEVAYPGEPFPVNPYWETARPLGREEEVMVWLRLIQPSPSADDRARGVVGLEDSYPGAGTSPASLWPAKQLLAGRQYVHVGADTPAPMVARLDVALYDAVTGELLAHPGEDLPTIGRVKVVPRRWPKVERGALVAPFDCGVSLAAYDLGRRVRPGEALSVTLTWTVQSRPGHDYTVFVHLVDDQAQVWGYGDSAPRQGNYPTWWWEPGEVVVDEHTVVLAPDAPLGRYRVVAGLYDQGGRVPVYGADGARAPDDAVDLGQVEVW